MNNPAYGQVEAKYCVCCNEAHDTAANPLVAIASAGVEEEFIHILCARSDHRFAFCRYCDVRAVYYSEDLNEACECEMHDGESVPDYPDEDADSYIENVRNNEGD